MIKPLRSRRRSTIALVASLFFVLGAAPVFAADSCGGGCPAPPKNSRAVSASTIAAATFPGNTLSATLAKGTKKRILYADGMMTDAYYALGGPIRVYALGISVNGLRMQPAIDPGNTEVMEDCGSNVGAGGIGCSVTGHWWLDMDDPSNAALVGVPITITLVGGDRTGSNPFPVDMSLRVRLEKK